VAAAAAATRRGCLPLAAAAAAQCALQRRRRGLNATQPAQVAFSATTQNGAADSGGRGGAVPSLPSMSSSSLLATAVSAAAAAAGAAAAVLAEAAVVAAAIDFVVAAATEQVPAGSVCSADRRARDDAGDAGSPISANNVPSGGDDGGATAEATGGLGAPISAASTAGSVASSSTHSPSTFGAGTSASDANGLTARGRPVVPPLLTVDRYRHPTDSHTGQRGPYAPPPLPCRNRLEQPYCGDHNLRDARRPPHYVGDNTRHRGVPPEGCRRASPPLFRTRRSPESPTTRPREPSGPPPRDRQTLDASPTAAVGRRRVRRIATSDASAGAATGRSPDSATTSEKVPRAASSACQSAARMSTAPATGGNA